MIEVRELTKTFGDVKAVDGALTGTSHFGAPIDVAVLIVVASVFVALGAWSFSRIEI